MFKNVCRSAQGLVRSFSVSLSLKCNLCFSHLVTQRFTDNSLTYSLSIDFMVNLRRRRQNNSESLGNYVMFAVSRCTLYLD